ncbi:MAG: YggT family protein [Gammaproteobacteria bacterium]
MISLNAVPNALIFLANTFFSIYVSAYLMRFLLQMAKGSFRNPIAHILVKITNPLLLPARKIVPGYAGIDLASVFVIFGLNFLNLMLIYLIRNNIPPIEFMALDLLFKHLFQILDLYFWMILALVIFSWFNPAAMNNNALCILFYQICEPLMARARRLIPPIAGLDLSPMIIMLGIQVIQILLSN